MNRTVKTHTAFLQLLYSTSVKQRKALLETITSDQLQILCEIALNVYRGTFPVSGYYIKKLLPKRISFVH